MSTENGGKCTTDITLKSVVALTNAASFSLKKGGKMVG